jgi:hypothetical protein
MEPWTTTLNAIREHSPCASGWAELLKSLGKTKADDEPLLLSVILDSNGLDDTLWVLRAVTNHDREIRLYSVWCARRVQHLMTDPRSISAINVAEQFAKGEVTKEILEAAWSAATRATEAAAEAAAEAAGSAAESAWSAARSAWYAAWAAAESAAESAWAAAWATAESAQKEELLRIISGGEY